MASASHSNTNSSGYIEDLTGIEQLFTNVDQSFSTIFPQLTCIYHRLIFDNESKISLAFDIILTNYIKLLDTDSFVDAITLHHSLEHHKFLRQYFSMLHRYDIRGDQTNRSPREIFFFLLDQLNSSKRIRSYLQNNLTNDHAILINTCSFVLYIVLTLVNRLDLMLTCNDLVKYQSNLLHSFVEFMDRYFLRKETTREYDILIEQMGSFLWFLSYRTPVIPSLIDANCPQACLRWLSLPYLDTSEYEYILKMLSNIALHDDGGKILNQLDCAKILRRFKKEVLNMKTDFIINNRRYIELCQDLEYILTLVVDLDELYLEEAPNGTIGEVLSVSRRSFEHPSRILTSALLIILMRLCTNDLIMDYILHHDQCPKFLTMIVNSSSSGVEKNFYKFIEDENDFLVLSITAIANIFWSISFDDRYKTALIQRINLIKKLETYPINHPALYTYIPHQMASLKRSIDGILYNLYPSKFEIKFNPTISKKRCSLMISYSQVNINFCRELFDMLTKLPELSIEVDFKNGKYSWKETAETIEQSDAILFLLSKEFYYSKSCRQEFIYVAHVSKKFFLPILIDPNWKPSGWLHKYIARLKSIHFGEKDFLQTCEELLGLINDNLSLNLSLINNTTDVTQWNEKEIKQWFTDHRIIPELYEFYHFQNGNELLLYAKATLAFLWLKEYERIKLRFEEKQSLSQDQFLQFIYALKRLPRQRLE